MTPDLLKELYRIHDELLARLALVGTVADTTEIWLGIENLLSELDDLVYSRLDESLNTLEAAAQVALQSRSLDDIEQVIEQLEEIGIGYRGK